jgi:hypothetical protein
MNKNYLSDNSGKEGENNAHIKYSSLSKNYIVEIGVLFGETTRVILQNSNCLVVGIDPIIPDSMNEHLIGSEESILNLKKDFNNFNFIKDFSFNVVKTWDKKIDYLFIDGDHNYEAVKNDFEDWFPHVSEGGIIAFHDSSANRGGPFFWKGPSDFADGLLEDLRLEYLETVNTMTIFKKK